MLGYAEPLRALNKARVPYVIVGVFGINLYAERAGLVVTTADCDIVLPSKVTVYDYEALWKRRLKFRVERVPVHVAPLPDLLRSKELADRPKDRLFLATYKSALEELLMPRPIPKLRRKR